MSIVEIAKFKHKIVYYDKTELRTLRATLAIELKALTTKLACIEKEFKRKDIEASKKQKRTVSKFVIGKKDDTH